MSKTTIIYKDIAPGAEEDAQITAQGADGMSDIGSLVSGVEPEPAITLELNNWLLDGTYKLAESQPIAFWSEGLSGGEGAFASYPVITVDFDRQYSSVGLTIAFDRASGSYCNSVNIKWFQGETLKSDKDFVPDGAVYFFQNQVESYDKIVITLKSTNLPYHRAKLEQIIFGVLRTFDMSEIRSASIVNETSLIGTELPVSTMNWTLDSRSDVDFMFQLKQPVEVRNDGNLIGVYYIDGYARKAKALYDIECYDALGVLDETPFPGGAYLEGISAKVLLSEIAGGDFPVYYAPGLADVNLKGVLMPSSKREAAQQVMFAWGACISTDGRDGLYVFSLPDTAAIIPEDRTYTGVTVDTSAIVTKVSVTAHTYTQDENGSIEINGVKYADNPEVYSVSNPNVTATDKQNVVEVTNGTLVSADIGQATAQRIYDYYLKRNTNKAKIVWTGERLGDYVTIPNAWEGQNTGHLARMEIRLSNTVAATCETIGV